MGRDLDLRLLRYFLTVAEEGTFTAAAKRLDMTQPALSRAIRSLEETVETPLLMRGPRGVEPTAAGALLRRDAQTLTDFAQAALTRLERLRQGETGLRVSARGCDIGVLQRLVESHNEQYPHARPSIGRLVDRQVQLDQIRDGEAEVTLIHGPFDRRGLDVECLRSDPRVAVLPESHPLAGRSRAHRSELTDEAFPQWIGQSATETAFWTGTDIAPYDWRPGPTVADISQFLGSIRLGQAIGFLAVPHVRDVSHSGVSIVPMIDGLSPSDLSVAWVADATSADVARFVRHACDELCA